MININSSLTKGLARHSKVILKTHSVNLYIEYNSILIQTQKFKVSN